MSGNGRKRDSKWDLKEESRNSFENLQDHAWIGKSGTSFHDKESRHGWASPDSATDHLKCSSVETLSGRRNFHRDDGVDEDHNRALKAMTEWDENESYGMRMSPGLDDWRQQIPCYSPKNEWKRSRRTRSPTRSRSRSRSPVHGFSRESGAYDRNRSRSGLSDQLCRDFSIGRCRRGSHCEFLHQRHEDSWERHRKPVTSRYSSPPDARDYSAGGGRQADCCNDFLKGNCRRGASCRFPHDGAPDISGRWHRSGVFRERDNDRRNRDASPDRHSERETRRAADIPCKFFAVGNCRNGKYCRFSHQVETRASPDRSRNDRWFLGRDSDDVEKPWNGPKWSDTITSSRAAEIGDYKNERMSASDPRFDKWSMEDRRGHNPNENKRIIDTKSVENDKRDTLQWKMDKAGDNMHPAEPRAAENWLGDMEMSPEWNPGLQPSNHIDKGQDASIRTSEAGVTQDASGGVHDAVAVVSRIHEKSFHQHDYNSREADAIVFAHDDTTVTGKTVSHIDVSATSFPSQIFNQNGPNSNSLPHPSLKVIGQSPVTDSSLPRVGNMVHAAHQSLLQNEGANKPDAGGANVNNSSSGIPMGPNTVSGEQLAQLANDIQASLVQLLANKQQLPEHFAAHSSHNGADVPSLSTAGGCVKPESAVMVQPSLAVGPHKQYDPICDSIEPEKHDCRIIPIEQNSIADGKQEMSLKNLSAPSSPGALNDGDNNVLCSSGEPHNEGYPPNLQEPDTKSEVMKESNGVGVRDSAKVEKEFRNAPENDPLDKIDGDGKPDESKKSKDAKGIRAFKFALVQFVKEVLKPKWKEGQMSKDAYKNIVKKVVDKVTGTMQGSNVPQTQEKIEQYLSFAKPKLTKLVQAYVDKLPKDK
uniref:C3H1-type domain-containing protein n=1 Tax=Rhizophora mucronata TaxID=61149 RepID=A0A2P2K5K1_RHIMU